VSQKGDTAKAINYALNQWAALTLYVDDGSVEIDNNVAECALRAAALGRKTSRASAPTAAANAGPLSTL
jgi:transposase